VIGRRITIRSVSRDLRSDDVEQEDNLLIEAMSLLVQRHRETETWLAEQIAQAEHRAAATERRYADLETRLTGIEGQLTRLAHELEPGRGNPAVDERLARLREQVEDLKSDGDGGPGHPVPPPGANPPAAPAPVAASAVAAPAPAKPPVPASAVAGPGAAEPQVRQPTGATANSRSVAAAPATSGSSAVAIVSGQAASVWEMMGPRPQDRFGLVLIGVGLLAVFYAILTQLRLG
jgi:hypothetical protein